MNLQPRVPAFERVGESPTLQPASIGASDQVDRCASYALCSGPGVDRDEARCTRVGHDAAKLHVLDLADLEQPLARDVVCFFTVESQGHNHGIYMGVFRRGVFQEELFNQFQSTWALEFQVGGDQSVQALTLTPNICPDQFVD